MKYIIIFSSFLTFAFSSNLVQLEKTCKEYKIPEACYELGVMYEKGFGIKKNINNAKKFYNLAKKYDIKKRLNLNFLETNSSIQSDNNKTTIIGN